MPWETIRLPFGFHPIFSCVWTASFRVPGTQLNHWYTKQPATWPHSHGCALSIPTGSGTSCFLPCPWIRSVWEVTFQRFSNLFFWKIDWSTPLKFNSSFSPEKLQRAPIGSRIVFQSHHFSGANCLTSSNPYKPLFPHAILGRRFDPTYNDWPASRWNVLSSTFQGVP